jgi:hypothetical protein
MTPFRTGLLLLASCVAGLLPQPARAHYLCVDRWGHRYTVVDLPFDNVGGLQCKDIPKPLVFAPGPGPARLVSPAPAPVAAAEPAARAVVPEARTAVLPAVTEVSAATVAAPPVPARSVAARPAVPPVVRLGPVRKAVTPSEMAGIFGFPLQETVDDRIGGLNAKP